MDAGGATTASTHRTRAMRRGQFNPRIHKRHPLAAFPALLPVGSISPIGSSCPEPALHDADSEWVGWGWIAVLRRCRGWLTGAEKTDVGWCRRIQQPHTADQLFSPRYPIAPDQRRKLPCPLRLNWWILVSTIIREISL